MHDRRGAVHLAGMLLAALIGALLGAAGFTFRYAEGLSYLSNDPRACVNCHVMRDQYDGWQKSSHHAAATCNDCHVPHDVVGKYMTKIDHGYRHSKGFTLQDFPEPIRATESSRRVVRHNCVRCHEAFVGDLTAADGAQPVRVGDRGIPAHARAGTGPGTGSFLAGEVDCIHCHAQVGHGPTR